MTFALSYKMIPVATITWEIDVLFTIYYLHIHYTDHKWLIFFLCYLEGFRAWRLYLLFWCTIVYSVLASLAQVTFHLIWCIEGEGWVVAHSWWAKLVGFARYLNLYIAVGLVDFICMHVHVFGLIHWYVSYKTNHVS